MSRNLNLSLRRINNVSRTLRISVPHKFVDERGLREGDQVSGPRKATPCA